MTEARSSEDRDKRKKSGNMTHAGLLQRSSWQEQAYSPPAAQAKYRASGLYCSEMWGGATDKRGPGRDTHSVRSW